MEQIKNIKLENKITKKTKTHYLLKLIERISVLFLFGETVV